MKYEILRSPTGKRWGRMDGSGIIAELKDGAPPVVKPKKRKSK